MLTLEKNLFIGSTKSLTVKMTEKRNLFSKDRKYFAEMHSKLDFSHSAKFEVDSFQSASRLFSHLMGKNGIVLKSIKTVK